jgi:lipoprotein-anchoring transpeptidase ErfK/SrfK
MGKLKAIMSTTILIWFVSAPSSAMPFSAQTIIRNVKNAQLVCDQFGRCWQTRSAPSAYPSARPGDALNVDPALGRQYAALYAPVYDERFPIPAVRLSDINPAYLRTAVFYPTHEQPGTIIIDPQNHFLYLVQGGGRALRYGVGVGRQGFGWSGVATIHDKQEWPDWYPPKEIGPSAGAFPPAASA